MSVPEVQVSQVAQMAKVYLGHEAREPILFGPGGLAAPDRRPVVCLWIVVRCGSRVH
jgi:hypothetical protein